MRERFVFLNSGPGGGPALFSGPVAVIAAHAPAEVPGALEALRRAQENGQWLAGFCAYELGYLLDARLAPLLPADRVGPLLCFGVFREGPGDGAERLRTEARAGEARAGLSAPAPSWAEADYLAAFARVKAYIVAGDIYQANLTFPVRARYRGDPLGLYAALQRVQPVAYGAVAALGDGPVLLSCAPELFFRVDGGGGIEARPMKGTMPRGSTPEEDRRLAAFLREDPKNRSENLMIVDLLRNDLARISEIGSVEVPELFTVESYATVHQMTSRIRAKLLAGIRLPDLLAALFPCGSITGAPKVRAMEIIRELEPRARDAYCGTIGWAAPDGTACFNVAIRTLSLFDDGAAVFNVGGAITHESDGPAEYEEAQWKARFATLPRPACG